jgi:hypothetical protein
LPPALRVTCHLYLPRLIACAQSIRLLADESLHELSTLHLAADSQAEKQLCHLANCARICALPRSEQTPASASHCQTIAQAA